MKNGAVTTIAFYVAAAACLWPLYLNAAQVVGYVQAGLHAHALLRLPPRTVLVALAEAALLIWAIPAAVMLFRKGQDSFAWLVALLVLFPLLSQFLLQR